MRVHTIIIQIIIQSDHFNCQRSFTLERNPPDIFMNIFYQFKIRLYIYSVTLSHLKLKSSGLHINYVLMIYTSMTIIHLIMKLSRRARRAPPLPWKKKLDQKFRNDFKYKVWGFSLKPGDRLQLTF